MTSIVKKIATPLQIALAVSLRDSKEQVKSFYDIGVTCSYDKLLRFKRLVTLNSTLNSKKSNLNLSLLGDLTLDKVAIMAKATEFITYCYFKKTYMSMTDAKINALTQGNREEN